MKRRIKNLLIGCALIALVTTPGYLWAVSYIRSHYTPFDQEVLYPYLLTQYGTTNAYMTELTRAYRVGDPDTSEQPRRSELLLYENGELLGPAHSPHSEIASLGEGRYSHWFSGRAIIMFSASDNSNPKTNGRVYRIRGY